MQKERFLDQLLSVFDLTICKASNLPESVTNQVIFKYNQDGDTQKFIVSNNGLPKDLGDQVTSWLEKNMDLRNYTLILTPKRGHKIGPGNVL